MNEGNNKDVKPQTAIQVENLAETMDQTLHEKSTPLTQVANYTFKELCLTLEHEQAKLIELEQRRKKLQEEMQLLKLEIEEEKKAYRTDLELDDSFESIETMDSFNSSICEDDKQKQMSLHSESTPEINDAEAENERYDYQQRSSASIYLPPLDTCFEVDEGNEDSESEDDGSETDLKEMSSVAANIHKQLQGVVAECIIEQCKSDDVTNAADEVY